jgi:hypothetical protein
MVNGGVSLRGFTFSVEQYLLLLSSKQLARYFASLFSFHFCRGELKRVDRELRSGDMKECWDSQRYL